MTRGLAPRVPLRDSGIPWLGEIPAHWEVRQLRFFCQSIQTGSTPSQEFMECSEHSETIDWFTPGDFSESLELRDSSRKVALEAGRRSEVEVFAPGTVFVVGIGATLGKVGFIRTAASANQQINALVPRPNVYSVLLAWALSTLNDVMRAMANSATLPILNQQRMGDLRIALPPIDEQRTIADYLDRETARLDGLVAAKERVLGLLAEKRRALITHAVTRGLDPRAPLRDSGIPWLGEIPVHWGIWKVSHFAAVGNGSTPSRDNAEYWTEGLIPWLNSSVVNQEEVTEADQFITETAFRECHLPLVKSGSVLVGITGQGKTRGQAVVLSFEATINQHLAFITPKKGVVDPWFLRWALFAAYDFLRSISDDVGGTKGALTCEEVGALKMPLPPIDEQRAIVAHIAATTAKLEALSTATERTVALLKERRTALIAAAVTGRLHIPEAT